MKFVLGFGRAELALNIGDTIASWPYETAQDVNNDWRRGKFQAEGWNTPEGWFQIVSAIACVACDTLALISLIGWIVGVGSFWTTPILLLAHIVISLLVGIFLLLFGVAAAVISEWQTYDEEDYRPLET